MTGSRLLYRPHDRPLTHNRVQFFVAAAAIFIFVLLFVLQSGRPLLLDNMDFPAAAAATAKNGLPVYYRGEESPELLTRPVYYDGKERQGHLALYHPPLYIYALASWFRIVGSSPTSARLFNIPFVILSGIIALLIFKRLFGPEAAWRVAPVFFIVYLLNPYALQVFSILDIDTSIYPLVICLSLWQTIRLIVNDGTMRTTPVSVGEHGLFCLLLILCLWSKLTTALLLPFFIGAAFGLRVGMLKGALYSVGLCGVSFFLFWLSYLLYGWATGLDVGYTWHFLIASLTSKGSSHGSSAIAFYLNRVGQNLLALSRWGLFPALFGAAAATLASCWLAWRSLAGERRVWLAIVFIILLSLSIVACYSVITAVFAGEPFKYVAPAWPIISIAYAALISKLFYDSDDSDIRLVLTSVATAILTFFIGLVVVKDHAILLRSGIPWRSLWLVIIVLLASCLLIFPRRMLGTPMVTIRSVVLIVFVAIVSEDTGVSVYQVSAHHATQYDYGQVGFNRLCKWIDGHTRQGDVIMSMKDVGFATGRPYLESYGYVMGSAKLIPNLGKNVSRLDINIFVFTTRFGPDNLALNPSLGSWIAQNTHKVAQIGDYSVFMRDHGR